MAVFCKFCNSPDMQAQLNTYQCLACGRQTPVSEVADQQAQIKPEPQEE
jgi:translation initiation factor 2 beta subunit (eIF-2beta)/eIF-5